MTPYIFIAITILGTVAGQLILKYGSFTLGKAPTTLKELIPFLIKALTNGYVLLSLTLAFIAALSWIIAISKVNLSFAYPFAALGLALVVIFSELIFHEHISWQHWLGVIIICLGIFLISRG